MKTLILTLLLSLISIKSHTKTFLGINQGTHINSNGLNNTHPYIGIEGETFGYLNYINSYNRLGTVIYIKTESSDLESPLQFSGKIALINGYTKEEGEGLFLTNNLMLAFIPGIKKRFDSFDVNVSLVGESISIGIEYKF